MVVSPIQRINELQLSLSITKFNKLPQDSQLATNNAHLGSNTCSMNHTHTSDEKQVSIYNLQIVCLQGRYDIHFFFFFLLHQQQQIITCSLEELPGYDNHSSRY